MDTWRDGRGTHQEPPHKTSHKRPYGCLPGTGGLAFEPEPGFYIGAMYISYAFTTGIVLMVGLLVYHTAGRPRYVGVRGQRHGCGGGIAAAIAAAIAALFPAGLAVFFRRG